MGILVKTAVLAWLVTAVTLAVFLAGILPNQKRTFLDNLESKARGIAVSLHDIAAGAVMTEDFSVVVDHCLVMLTNDETIEYLVLVRHDGFALIHTRDGWRNTTLEGAWRPADRLEFARMLSPPFLDGEAFHYSRPFDYSGIEWGWIHIGLSLETYRENVKDSYRRTFWMAGLGLLIGLVASIVYARLLVAPIIRLRGAARSLADGNLEARADVRTGDELEILADSFNSMAHAIQDREGRLTDQSKQLARFVTRKPFHEGDVEEAARLICRTNTRLLGVDRVSVWLLNTEKMAGECVGISRAGNDDPCSAPSFPCAGNEPFFNALKSSRILSVVDASADPRTSCLVEQNEARTETLSVMDAPVRIGEDIVGIVCHAQEDGPRHWTADEENYAASTADLMAMAIVSRERRKVREDLVAAKEAAEAASEAKSQFLANMSHEIRTPLNGVIGMLQLIGRGRLDNKQTRNVSEALSAAETLTTVLGDVLDFSKIESGLLELDSAEFTLRDAIYRSVRLFAKETEEKGLELGYSVAQDAPNKVFGDSIRLQQILINLVGNAVKFTDEGEVFVQCDVVERSERDLALRFVVTDTGSGIPEAARQAIFESFSQGDSSMVRRHGGTGLGLSIAQHLVRLMNGEIKVMSEEGEGSRFEFTVVLGKRSDASESTKIRRLIPLEMRVLVVGNTATSRSVIRNSLEGWGCSVDEVRDASGAMRTLDQPPGNVPAVRLVVVDAGIVGTNGLELSKLIRSRHGRDSIGIVLLSGFEPPEAEELDRYGVDAVIPKPVRSSSLFDAIISIVHNEGVGCETTSESSSRKAGDAAGLETTSKSAPQTVEADAGKGRVLLVEDNEISREVATEIVAFLGYDCSSLTSGVDAADTVMNGEYDLVLMDCQMPVVDGYEATRAIRRAESEAALGRRIPIVALTAHTVSDELNRCLEAGMDDYLSKPVHIEVLGKMLAKWLPQRSGDGTSESGLATGTEGDSLDFLDTVADRCCGDRDLALELVRIYVSQSGADLTAMSSAIRADDSDTLKDLAHRLKGAAGNLGFDDAMDIASELEERAARRDLDVVAPLVEQLRDLVDEIENTLPRGTV